MPLNFSNLLLEWHDPSKRDMPWKKTKDPYLVWLSEIILQQTRVEQGLPYYLEFASKFPTIRDLAIAKEEYVLKTWEGLGYYSRARNLQKAANQILEKHNGIFPKNYVDILALKGVGFYTAAAISSFAFDQPYAVLDGNVYRVLSRYFGIDTPIDTNEGKKKFTELANKCLDKNRPADYNQAIMDLGATVCTPKLAKCNDCPVSSDCVAYRENTIYVLPVKSKKLIRKKIHFHFLVVRDHQHVLIEKRNESSIWKGLFQFPALVSEEEQLSIEPKDLGIDLNNILQKKVKTGYKQALTHRDIEAIFTEISVDSFQFDSDSILKIKISDIQTYAFPKIIRQYLKETDNCLI